MGWEPNEQIPPQPDARYRVHKSEKCYVASIQCGTGWCTLYLEDSIERVVHKFSDGTFRVIYKDQFYLLREPSELESLVREHLALKGGVNLAGGAISYTDRNQDFKPFHFINVTSKQDFDCYKLLKPKWISSDSLMGKGQSNTTLVETKSWSALTEDQQVQMLDLLGTTGEVTAKGLRGRLELAKMIAICVVDEKVVACGAIKIPDRNYRQKIFQSANSRLNCDDFEFEIGYISVVGRHRRKGLGHRITNSLASACKGQGVFATTRSDNRKIQTKLASLGFEVEGSSFHSARGKYSLMLWIKMP